MLSCLAGSRERVLSFPMARLVPSASTAPTSRPEAPARDAELSAKLNRLRAGVLGANDGIVSVAAVVVGVAGATSASAPVLTAGAAALIGGAVSMALGEYVSVGSQKDALLARRAAGGHVEDDEIVSPWAAAAASFVSFFLGAVLPMLAIMLPPADVRIPVTVVATLVALALTGAIGAGLGGSSRRRAAVRVVIGGAVALAVTYGVGSLLGAGIA